MENYSIKQHKTQVKNTLLRIMSNDISHLFGDEVPFPHNHYLSNEYNRMVYCWYIDGYFETQKGVRFLNDIIARFKLSAECRLHSFKTVNNENTTPYKLKQFQGLKSLVKERMAKEMEIKSLINSDYVYTCLVLQAEKYIKNDGLIIYERLENWAFDNFLDLSKDKSTLRAKCRNCWHWYNAREWQLYHTIRIKKDKGEIMATRQEHAKKIHTKLANDTKKKVLNCITGMFAHEYKKPNGKWNISKIAKDSGTTRPTVMKYLPKDTLL
jgi:ribosomal protein S17E